MWESYRKVTEQEMRPYVLGEDLTGVSVSSLDIPSPGGMIARGADDNALWYVSERFFRENYRPVSECRRDEALFIRHIEDHLSEGQVVVCKICGMSVAEIANQSLNQPDAG